MLAAFAKNRVSDNLFAGTTGYGYDDYGRDTLDRIYADIFGTEAALVRIGFVNGTHALSCALFSAVQAGDTVLSVTGPAYDTLQNTITGDYCGSMKRYGIGYKQVDLKDGVPDLPAIASAARDDTVKLVFIQRSRGYAVRKTLSCAEIGEICPCASQPARRHLVDNCYGEFVEELEPTQVGADLIAGSLIKNPGGGLAPTGGYIAGRADLVENAAYKLTAPGIGGECGCTMGQNRLLYQGLSSPPHHRAGAQNRDLLRQGDGKAGLRGQPPRGGAAVRHHSDHRSARPTRCAASARAFRPARRWIRSSRPSRGTCPAMTIRSSWPRGVRAGRVHRAVRGRAHARALCVLYAGRPDLFLGQGGHPARRRAHQNQKH